VRSIKCCQYQLDSNLLPWELGFNLKLVRITNLFYFGTTLHMPRTVPPPITRSPRLHTQHQAHVIQVLWVHASMQSQNLHDTHPTMRAQSQTPDDGRRDRPKHAEYLSWQWDRLFFTTSIFPCHFHFASPPYSFIHLGKKDGTRRSLDNTLWIYHEITYAFQG